MQRARRSIGLQMRALGCAAGVLLGAECSYGLSGVSPALSNPTRVGDQVQFVLSCATNTSYLIQFSSDLQIWRSVLTNFESSSTRMITVPATTNRGFWRVAGPLFESAIVARGQVNLAGDLQVDSFDSADPSFSTDGQYDPLKRKDRGDVVSGSDTDGAINVGNSEVAGIAWTRPGRTITLGPNGGVGSIAWLSNPSTAGTIEPGRLRDDMNVTFRDAQLPQAFGPIMAPVAGVVAGTNYTYVLGNGDYRLPVLNLGSGQRVLVTGHARLYVMGNINLTSDAHILIGSGASLKLYAGGSASISGAGIINSGNAMNFQCYGLNTSISVSYSGLSPFTGTIYAPRASVSIIGTSSAVGAIVGHSVTVSGNAGFHFDENLRRSGPFF
jgi:hypothetical protein